MSPLSVDDVLAQERKDIFGAEAPEQTPPMYALCLSGGGIRSAAFSLGIIQALATSQKAAPETPLPNSNDNDVLLRDFHYLSTVSGGGFIGGWLTTWLKRSPFKEVRSGLNIREGNKEAGPLLWLRSNTNYLTPVLGVFSGDTVAALALSLRNLLLNWLIVLPAICCLIVLIKMIGIASNWVIFWGLPPHDKIPWSLGLLLRCVLQLSCLIPFALLMRVSLRFSYLSRPSEREEGPSQMYFLLRGLLPGVVAAFFMAHFLASDAFGSLLLACSPDGVKNDPMGYLTFCPSRILLNADKTSNVLRYSEVFYVVLGALFGAILYLSAALPSKTNIFDQKKSLWPWLAAGAFYGMLVAVGSVICLKMPDQGYRVLGNANQRVPIFYLQIVFGVPWLLFSQACAEMIFVGLASETTSDIEREWFGHTSGFYLLSAIIWFTASALVFMAILGEIFSGYFSFSLGSSIKEYIPIVAALSGAASALLAKIEDRKGNDFTTKIVNFSFTLSAFVFSIAFIIFLSSAIDHSIFGQDLVEFLADPLHKGKELETVISQTWTDLATLLPSLLISFFISAVAARWVNTNFFSLHAMYRNRLIRAYLGASRIRRRNRLIDMDEADNPPMANMNYCDTDQHWCPFHVVNTSLNMVSASNPAWQERKATSFTISPLHCGSAEIGYRRSAEYTGKHGITLGTAIAISGAAASPNMGSYSSPGKTFFMTLFNMRLGAWLGNTGSSGETTYQEAGPEYSLLPWVQEAFGLTTDDSKYIYLSDGGHFDNLGVYEMIRRRCKIIVAIDSTCDAEYKFSDLGNSMRKIAIDFGIDVQFYGFNDLIGRQLEDRCDFDCSRYFMIGRIIYDRTNPSLDGTLLYIKPSYHKNEGASIRGYAETHKEFPHEKTSNQWFTESQFETYRILGLRIMLGIIEDAKSLLPNTEEITLGTIVSELASRKIFAHPGDSI